MSQKQNSFFSRKTIFKEIFLPRIKALLIGVFLIIIGRAASMVLPGASKFLVDKVFTDGNIGYLKWILIAVMSAITIQAISNFILVKIIGIEAHKFIADLRIKIQQRVIKLPLTFFYKENSGAILSRIMNDVEGIRNIIGTGLVQIFGGVLAAIFAFLILIRINLMMTMLSVAILLVFAFILAIAFKKIRPIFKQRKVIQAEVNGRLIETIGGIKVIRSFAAEEKEEKIFAEGSFRIFNNIKKSMTAQAFIVMLTLFLTGITSSLVMGLSSILISKGEMTSGDFVAFLMYLATMSLPIVQISRIGTELTDAFAGMERVNEVFSYPLEQEKQTGNKKITNISKQIEFKNVHFSYGEEEEVLSDLSFTIKKGKMVALVGSSGSGKSTISQLALSLLHPTKGQVLIDGKDLKESNLHSYRQNLAVVLQDDFLFNGTIKENITFTLKDKKASESKLKQAIEMAYVNEFSDKLEKGIDTVIGERGVKLSGGQKQRISIARAILADPKFLVLDEATSSLDSESEFYIQKALAQLCKNRTILVIAHRLSTIKKADEILVIENGKIVESGNHKQLIAKKKRYYKLYNIQGRI